jgi:hypothetical protein
MSYIDIPSPEGTDDKKGVHVEVPAQPPVFDPESARALLNLFRAVLEKRRQQEGNQE